MKYTRLCGLVLVIALVLVTFAWIKAPDLIAWGMSKELKVTVTIDDIDLSPKSLEVIDLEISNPEGSLLPKALVAKSISVHTPINRFLESEVVIDEIVIDGLYLSLESHAITDPLGNWSTILGAIPKGESEKKPESQKESKQKVVIKKLRITNINADFAFLPLGNAVHKLPTIAEIELTDISSDENVVKTILNQVVYAVGKGLNPFKL